MRSQPGLTPHTAAAPQRRERPPCPCAGEPACPRHRACSVPPGADRFHIRHVAPVSKHVCLAWRVRPHPSAFLTPSGQREGASVCILSAGRDYCRGHTPAARGSPVLLVERVTAPEVWQASCSLCCGAEGPSRPGRCPSSLEKGKMPAASTRHPEGPLSLRGHHPERPSSPETRHLPPSLSPGPDLAQRNCKLPGMRLSPSGIFYFYQTQEIRFDLCSDRSKIILGTVGFQPL